MYCSICGQKIDEHTKYCKHCNVVQQDTPVKNETRWLYKRLVLILRIISVLCIFISVFLAISYFAEPAIIEKIDTLSIVSNNLQNGGYASCDDQYHYYFDQSGLIRAEINNELSPEAIYITDNFFGLNNNWLYAYCGNVFFADTGYIYYKASNDEVSGIRRNEMFRSFFAEHPQSYYLGSQTEPYPLTYNDVEIASIPAEGVYQYGLNLYIFSGDVTNGVDNPKPGLWQADLDGGNLTQVLDFCPGYFVVWGEQAFFTNGEKLYISNVDGTNAKLVPNVNVFGGLNVDAEHIYYVDAESRGIFRIDKNGKNSKQLTEENCSSIAILGEWMYYLRHNSGETHLCRMHLKDLKEQIVVKNWD